MNKRPVSPAVLRAKKRAEVLKRDFKSSDVSARAAAALRLQHLSYYDAMTPREILAQPVTHARFLECAALEHGFTSWSELERSLRSAQDRRFLVKIFLGSDTEEVLQAEIIAPSEDVAVNLAAADAETEHGTEDLEVVVVEERPYAAPHPETGKMTLSQRADLPAVSEMLQHRLRAFPVVRLIDGFPVRANEAHEFYEDDQILLLRCFGETFWTRIEKSGDHHRVAGSFRTIGEAFAAQSADDPEPPELASPVIVWRSWHDLEGPGRLDTSVEDGICACDAGEGPNACNLCRSEAGSDYLNPTPADLARHRRQRSPENR